MARFRIVPTPLTTAADIAKSLTDMGLRDVEVHSEPAELIDWIGRPTGVKAHVIVRRKTLGAASDDFGLVRTERGTYDALLTDLHLFRFDRKWFIDLARRSGMTMPEAKHSSFEFRASPPTQTAREHAALQKAAQAASTRAAKPDLLDSGRGGPTSPAATLEHGHRSVEELQQRFKRAHAIGPLGCLLFFAPLVVWCGAWALDGRRPKISMLVGAWFLWCFPYFGIAAVVLATRARKHVNEFSERFPPNSASRATAVAWLRSKSQEHREADHESVKKFLNSITRASTPKSDGPLGKLRPKGGRRYD